MRLDRRLPALLTFALLLAGAAPAFADVAPEKFDTPPEKDKGKKGGDCSVLVSRPGNRAEGDPKLELASLAALALLFSGAALRRRRS